MALADLITGGQPISNEDETLSLVTNGEDCNHRELRRELEQRGHCFRTLTDVKVILHLYEELGTNCFQRLNGMFAVAILDNRSGTLILRRDRCGMEPLYYSETRVGFLFASEPGVILTSQILEGPWSCARKILRHEKHDSYNIVHHPFFDQDGGRVMYSEGT